MYSVIGVTSNTSYIVLIYLLLMQMKMIFIVISQYKNYHVKSNSTIHIDIMHQNNRAQIIL